LVASEAAAEAVPEEALEELLVELVELDDPHAARANAITAKASAATTPRSGAFLRVDPAGPVVRLNGYP
jgi:hypothetical protein